MLIFFIYLILYCKRLITFNPNDMLTDLCHVVFSCFTWRHETWHETFQPQQKEERNAYLIDMFVLINLLWTTKENYWPIATIVSQRLVQTYMHATIAKPC